MMFRDMMRCVSGACCAAVMMCGASMVEDAKGMNDDHKTQDEYDMASLSPIVIDFPFLVSSKPWIEPLEWCRLFELISPNVEFMLNVGDVSYSLDAIRIFCSGAFESFVSFVGSSYCDSVATNRVISFFNLFPLALHDIIAPHEYGVLKQLVCNLDSERKPILTQADGAIFRLVYPVLDNYLRCQSLHF
ncbi:MAG: hypothetical protein LBF54_02750 [Holosporaceae bacterium]|jgi:hypothetical protein|nr:hypothetical protein [Holosporaceae bacterium]